MQTRTTLITLLLALCLIPQAAVTGADNQTRPADSEDTKSTSAKQKEIAEGLAVIEELDVVSLRAFTRNLHRRASQIDRGDRAAEPKRLREARRRLEALKKELTMLEKRYAALQKENNQLGGDGVSEPAEQKTDERGSAKEHTDRSAAN